MVFWQSFADVLQNTCFSKTSDYQTEKKSRDKRLIKNWRPLPLLNIDLKTLKGSLIKIKGSSLKFNSSQQTAYMKNRQFG